MHRSDSTLTMTKNAVIVVGRPAAIPEGDGGRDLMIQPVYITWTEKDGKLGLMRQLEMAMEFLNAVRVRPWFF